MRIRDFLVTAASAVATVALTLTLIGPAPVDAGLPDELQLPPAPLPTLAVGDIELTLEGELGIADEPVARLRAVNNSGQPVEVTADLRLYAQAPRNPMARMISMPRETWKQPCLVELAPGETRELQINDAPELPEGNEGFFTITVGELQLASARFAPKGLQRVAFELAPEPHVMTF